MTAHVTLALIRALCDELGLTPAAAAWAYRATEAEVAADQATAERVLASLLAARDMGVVK